MLSCDSFAVFFNSGANVHQLKFAWAAIFKDITLQQFNLENYNPQHVHNILYIKNTFLADNFPFMRQEYHDKTCIRFRPRTSEQAYIHIMKEIMSVPIAA
jgi:hypothetical protein